MEGSFLWLMGDKLFWVKLMGDNCQSWRDIHFKIYPHQSTELWKYLSWLAWPWYFICKVNSTNRVLLLKNTLHTLPQGLGVSCNAFFDCNILQGASIMELLGFLSCKSSSWKRCICTIVLLVCKGREVGELVQPGGMWGLPWGLLCRS